MAPETVDVDEIESSEDERKRRLASFPKKPSSDELNILSRPRSEVDVQHSRYLFPAANGITPDGPATAWIQGRYGDSQRDSPEHDPITAYTSEAESGNVKAKIAKLEELKKEGLQKIDLSKMQKGKAKKINMQSKVRIARPSRYHSARVINLIPRT